jgi:predicted nucleic acid-binding protein
LQAILDEVVWIDIDHPDILDAYGEIDHASRTSGRSMGKNDVWIAATAKVTKATLLTTDVDFDHLHGTHLDRIWINPGATTNSP